MSEGGASVDPQRIDELEAALALAREEINAKDAEIAALKEQLQAQADAPKLETFKVEEMQKLQERLGALRRDQSEADAAKDAAWKQLKANVLEVVQLANPEKVVKTASQWQ
jgi:hypothetical protein